ncbi:hypothetical protein TRFO_07653 [Tritrichomonas foetus]|uniref:ABC transporter domain-containing protein n=1 Tax=Tritrichomonas foetus TaxID=1144522 RepID=A0A1J4JUR8_9EUKA|nr:hypothetical protein TRFO_07653 [Tritrichomonas foetus]|eukprot:OHT00997.1 hypothetical protein TRFO_07653 [Tritrichomonas foetus]
MKISAASTSTSSIADLDDKDIKVLRAAPFGRQLATMLRITFLQRLRSLTLILEIILPVIFLVFLCLFAAESDPYTDPNPHPDFEQIIPFTYIQGPAPSYGMIPDTNEAKRFIDVLNEKAPSHFKENVTYFKTFQDYKEYIWGNKEVNDRFYSSEWNHTNDYSENDILISSNGMTLGSFPYLIQNLGATLINLTRPAPYSDPVVFLRYKKYPHQPLLQINLDNSLYVSIFSTVQPIIGILTTGIYYGTEAESGLRDLFTFFGLGFFVNELRWYIVSFVMLFITSIPFAIALTGFMGINFGLMIVFYILSSTSYTSFLLFLMSLWPTHNMGNIAAYGTLFTFFICIFWGFFDWLFKEKGYTEKYVLSILPHAALSFTMAQMGSGEITSFSQIDGPKSYPIKNGFIYLAVESVVYFLLYILIEAVKRRKWLPAPIKWKNSTNFSHEESPIVVSQVRKNYGKTVAVDNVSFEVNQNETLAIVGPNGAGKSTLMSILSGTMIPDDGTIKFRGVNISKNVKTIHQIVGLCPQENLFMNELTVDEWIKAVCELRNEPNFDYSEIFMTLGLDAQRRSRIGKMSGGNKRKTCLAAALVCNPPVVVLDEATSGVDFTSRTRIWSIISGLKDTTVIMATHTLEECEKIADRIMVLADGQISECATPNELRQIFKCGYLIETDEDNLDNLVGIAREAGLEEEPIIDDRKVKLHVSSDDSDILSHLLHKIDFKYILTIQSLEEQIFDHVQKYEMEKILKEEGMNERSDASCESAYLSEEGEIPPI